MKRAESRARSVTFGGTHWVPVPKAADIAELNRELLAGCRDDETRMIAGREQSVSAALLIEREHLLPLVSEGMDMAHTTFPTANSLGCAKVLTNSYSAPLKAGTVVQAKFLRASSSSGRTAVAWPGMNAVTSGSNRSSTRSVTSMFYLESPARSPVRGPLEQQRKSGLWPESFDVIWKSLIDRHGKQASTRHMIDLLKLGRRKDQDRLRKAIETALATGCTDAAAVQPLFHTHDLNRVPCETIDIGFLERYQRPMPVMNEYDQLLAPGGAR